MEDDLNRAPRATDDVLDADDVSSVLRGAFYVKGNPRELERAKRRGVQEKPAHYKVICISLYNEDLQQLDAMVDTLKARGFTKASRSALIRIALEQVDLTRVRKGL